MKRTLFLLFSAALASLSLLAAPRIQRAEPLCWWTDMHMPLTLMLQGQDLANAQVSIQPSTGLTLVGQHNAESQNYLFLDLDVKQPGTYTIALKKNGRTARYRYTIYPRTEGSNERLSFDASDVVYLLMSDRFVDGDTTNNTIASMSEKCNKTNVNGRFGGDIQGIIQSLDHIAQLGATTIWPTPLLEDNEAEWSYHGYACSDYYHIDPRYGSNDLYRAMVEKAHDKGLKVIMDMVPNHCGSTHWWMNDLPYHNWISQWNEYTVTNNVFSANYDIHASNYDRQLNNGGWFDHPMPDMNLTCPDELKYFQQWAIWWIEFAGLDGLRVDTYPYIHDQFAGAEWLKAIREEYPNINIVGECWTRPASNVAYWQAGARNFDGFDSHLPTVMDFPVEEAIRQALENDGNFWGGGLIRVYDAISMDYLYSDINKLLLFVGNHDMDRFADVVKDNDLRRVKLGHVLLATLRGIPQLFAGDEYAMRSSDRSKGHSTLRMPMPDATQLTDEQRDMFNFQSRLYQFRKQEPILHFGKMMHFAARDNTYAYFRYTDDGAILVYLNASEGEKTIPTANYAELLNQYNPVGKDILTDETIDLHRTDLTVAPLTAIVVKLTK